MESAEVSANICCYGAKWVAKIKVNGVVEFRLRSTRFFYWN